MRLRGRRLTCPVLDLDEANGGYLDWTIAEFEGEKIIKIEPVEVDTVARTCIVDVLYEVTE